MPERRIGDLGAAEQLLVAVLVRKAAWLGRAFDDADWQFADLVGRAVRQLAGVPDEASTAHCASCTASTSSSGMSIVVSDLSIRN